MKQIFEIFIFLIPFFCFAQKNIPIINAHSPKAQIYQQDNPVSGWTINPAIKMDAFTTNKLVHPKIVTFKTDTDSIRFKIRPGKKKDFIVLLNGTDSCFTRIQSPEIKNFSKLAPEIHDSIPFFVNKYNTNFVKVVFDQADSLSLNFDTGATEVLFTTEALKKKITSNPKLYSTNYDLKIGNTSYKSKIYDTELVGNETDGLLGWDLFDGMIVELDYDKNEMILHSRLPKSRLNGTNYSKFKIHFINKLPFIKSEIVQSGIKHENWFLFDLGYQKTLMLDPDLLREANFPTDSLRVIKKVMMHGTKGNEVPVITSNLETLKLGNFELKNVPAQVLGQNKPMRGANIHILGNEVLKRFNTILNFQKNVIYLTPNHLYNIEYSDQKKNGA